MWTAEPTGAPVQIHPVYDESEEAYTVASRISAQTAIGARKFGEFAILYRMNSQSYSLERSLLQQRVPYQIIGGVRFYDRKEIKDVIAYLRLLYQPADRPSLTRIVNVPTRGLGTKSLETFVTWQSQTSMNCIEALESVDLCTGLTPRAKSAFHELGLMLGALHRNLSSLTLSDLMEAVIKRTGYLEYLDDGSLGAEDRQANVRELVSDAKERIDTDLTSYLEDVSLISDLDAVDDSTDAITLMTLHAAKGLEFPVVFMVGLEETIFPHTRALYDISEMEEERRLCYVGMTRARQELYMTTASSRLIFGQRQHNPPSRFLSDIESYETSPALSTGATGLPGEAEFIPEEQIDLSVGDKVRHQIFGSGLVVDIEGTTISVVFKGGGSVKKLNVAFAPLEKVI